MRKIEGKDDKGNEIMASYTNCDRLLEAKKEREL